MNSNRLLVRAWWFGVGLAGVLVLFRVFDEVGSERFKSHYLPFWSVFAIQLSLLVAGIGVVIERKRISSCLSGLGGLGRRRLLALMLFLVATVSTAACARPGISLILFDEQIYQHIAQMIVSTGEARMLVSGDVDDLSNALAPSEYNKQPPGYPVYLSWFYRVFGMGGSVPFLANLVAYGIATLSVAGISGIIFRSFSVALFSGAVFALTPTVLIWTRTSAAEPSAAAFSALAIFALLLFRRFPSLGTGLTLAGLSAFSGYFRPESFLILLPVGLGIFFRNRKAPLVLRFRVSVSIGVLLIPLFFHLLAFQSHPWGGPGEKFSLAAFWANLPVNGLFFLNNRHFPAVFTLLAGVGLISSRAMVFEKVVLGLWFAVGWAVFLAFYAGSYDYGMDSRFSVLAIGPVAILAGAGLFIFARRMSRWTGRGLAFALSGMLIVIASAWFSPYVMEVTEDGGDARMDADFANTNATLLPPRSYVLSHTPSMWLIAGVSAGQTFFAHDHKQVSSLLTRFRGGVYFHWDYWCNAESLPRVIERCQWVLKNYETQLVTQSVWKTRRAGLYRLFEKR